MPNHGVLIGSYIEEFVQHLRQEAGSHAQQNFILYDVTLRVAYRKEY